MAMNRRIVALYTPTVANAMNDIYGLGLNQWFVQIVTAAKHEISGYYIILRMTNGELDAFRRAWPQKTLLDGIM